MFWDKNKKPSDFPPLPMPPQFPSPSSFNYESPENTENQEDSEINQLPAFPDSPVQKGFSQMAIKDAVSSSYLPDSPQTGFPQNQSMELSESEKSSDSELAISKSSNYKISGMSGLKSEKKPIFVRLDKFQVARASLEEMKQKIYDIEEALGKIKDIKAREDQELMLWEKEIEMMKARVGAIIKDIFERGE